MASKNWTELINNAGAGFEPVPANNYDAEIVECKAQETNNKKTMYVCKFNILSGPYANKKIFNNFVVSPDSANAMAYFFAHMAALGLPKEYFAAGPTDDAIAQALVGRKCTLKVAIREYGGANTNEVKGVLAPNTAVAGAPAGAPPVAAAAGFAAPPPVAMAPPPVVSAPPPVAVPPVAPPPIPQPGPVAQPGPVLPPQPQFMAPAPAAAPPQVFAAAPVAPPAAMAAPAAVPEDQAAAFAAWQAAQLAQQQAAWLAQNGQAPAAPQPTAPF